MSTSTSNHRGAWGAGVTALAGWRARRQDLSAPVSGKHHRAPEGTIPAGQANQDSPPRSQPPPQFFDDPPAGPPPPPGVAPGLLVSWQVARVGRLREQMMGSNYHVGSPRNATELAGWLREDAPWCSDAGLAVVLLTWLEWAAKLSESPWQPDVLLRMLREATELAVLQLTGEG